MKQALMCESVGQAFAILKSMAPDDERWEEEAHRSARQAYKAVLESTMHDRLDAGLARLKSLGEEDRRNGSFRRRLLTAVGEIELEVPRTRRFSAVAVIGAYCRRSAEVDRAILGCFLLGVSTRKVGAALAPLLGERPSAGTVSRVAKQLDGAVAAFHRRPLRDSYRFLILDGVAISMRSGEARKRQMVLVALGILPDGRKEVIDFAVADGESQAAWEGLLQSLYRRGLAGEGLELIACDGGAGLLAALPLIYPLVPVQRCWAHKTRNVLDKIRDDDDREEAKADLHAISYATTLGQARHAMRDFRKRWSAAYPAAVRCLLGDEDQMPAFLSVRGDHNRKLIRTTNAIERLFREVRRRTDTMGVFYDRTSIARILYSVFTYHNQRQGSGAPFSLMTQNS